MLKKSKTSQEINERFFEAIEILKRMRRMRGLCDFAVQHDISYGNLCTIKNHGTGIIKPEYLYILAKEYGVSAKWLLLGEGFFFEEKG